MRVSASLPALIVVAAVACDRTDAPTAPGASASVQIAPTVNSPCTVHWAAGVNGSWFDATKWNPQGVPDGTSSVCIDASGTYTVTVDPANDATPVSILALAVGSASGTATVILGGGATILDVQEGIDIAAGGLVELRNATGATITAGQTLTNDGVLAAIAPCGGCGTQNVIRADLVNRGTLTGAAVLTLGKVDGAYQNTGTINITTGQIVIPATAGNPTFAQDGGVVMGTGNFATLTMHAGTYTANGGELRQRNAANPKPIIVLDGANLELGTLADPAVIGVRGGAVTPTTITGDIPALTTLWLAGAVGQAGTIAFAGNPVNAGTIHPASTIDGNGGALTLSGSGRLTNAGSILQSTSSGSGVTIHYQINVTNDGTIGVTNGNHVNFDKAGGNYQNNGNITLGPASSTVELRVVGSMLVHTGGAIDGGSLIVDGGRLLGTAPVTSHIRTTNGGRVEPGLSPGIMPVRSFRPTATGVLGIELAGIAAGSEYDQVQATLSLGGVGTLVSLAGTLDLTEVNGFQSGLCGQVFDVLVHSIPSGIGTFGTVNGLNPGAGRALRVVYQNATVGVPGSGRVRLVGYDDTAAVCIGPNPVAVSEGGAGVQYAVLLNHAPTTSVTVTAQADAQVLVTPSQLIFTATNWQRPQFFTVIAVDDGAQEGPHSGSVTHAVSSTDASYQGFVPATLAANITDNDVNLPPVAGNDAATTPEDTPVDVDVLANDSDPEGAAISVAAVSAAQHGSVQVINGGAAVRYTPATNVNGADSFTYTVVDAGGAATTASVNLSITGAPDDPVAGNDQATVRSGVAIQIDVRANDSDPDGDALTVTQVTAPGHGTAVINAGQTVTYQSAAGYVGSDAFMYTIDDGTGRTATAIVSMSVLSATANTPPVAVDDPVQMKKPSGSIRVYVLDNDTDADGDALSITGVSAPTAGSASISGRTIVYTIANPQAGSDAFTYTISDGFGGSASATVRITWPIPAPQIDLNLVQLNGQNILVRDQTGTPLALFVWVGAFIQTQTSVATTYTVEFTLPSGLLDLGDRISGSHVLDPLTIPPNCSVTSSGGRPRLYRCTVIHPGGPGRTDSNQLFLVRMPLNMTGYSITATVVPNDPDPDRSNHTLRIRAPQDCTTPAPDKLVCNTQRLPQW